MQQDEEEWKRNAGFLGSENERVESPINLNDKDCRQFGGMPSLCHFKSIKTMLMPR